MQIKLPLKYENDIKICATALLYYLFARLGYFLAFEHTSSLPAWPPSGIAFALIILLGRSSWPGITIGALIANVMEFWDTPGLSPQTAIAVSSSIAIGSTIEVLLGNNLVQSWIKDAFPFRTTKNAFRFLFVTIVMCVVGVSIEAFTLYSFNITSLENLLRAGFSSLMGNAVGILLFTPFVLAISQKQRFIVSSEKTIEIGIFILTSAAVYGLVHTERIGPTLERSLPFLVLPLLLWLAFRFDLLIALTGILISSLFAIYKTIHGHGPFALPNSYESMMLLQIFIGVISISTIILSATVRERSEAQLKLKEFNLNLEEMVQERTKELNDEIATRKQAEETLHRTNQELSKRNTELDNFVYSVSHDLRAPIASVLGLINLAKKDDDLAMKDMYLEMVHKSALQQDNFIKEILDQSRNSRLEVRREKIVFEDLIEETFSQLRFVTTTGKAVEKIVNAHQKRPFYSDRWRLKVILNNIVSNSIRYRNGKDPVIHIDVEMQEHGVTLAIKDNGKGIEKDHLPNIYKMFYRATDDGAGSGLGLYIVKETIDKLQGKIDIESEVGKGTTVKMEIPEIA